MAFFLALCGPRASSKVYKLITNSILQRAPPPAVRGSVRAIVYLIQWLITNISLVVFLLRIYGQTLTLGQTPGDFVKNDAFARTVLIDTLLNSPREIIPYLTAVPQCLCLVSGLFFSSLPLFLVQCPTCQFTHSSSPRPTQWHDDVQITFDGITVPDLSPKESRTRRA